MKETTEQFLEFIKEDTLAKKKKAILKKVDKNSFLSNDNKYGLIFKRNENNECCFREKPSEEEINALYDALFPDKETPQSVKNNWLTFIGILFLVEIACGLLWILIELAF